jgi:hypothetical protein
LALHRGRRVGTVTAPGELVVVAPRAAVAASSLSNRVASQTTTPSINS